MVASAEIDTRAAAVARVSASDREAVSCVRRWLQESGYAAHAQQALMRGAGDEGVAMSAGDAPPIARLFLNGEPFEATSRKELADPETISALRRTGLIRDESDRLVPQVRITMFDGLFVVADRARKIDSDAAPDVVTGVTPITNSLARFSIRAHVENTLDLGTGAGVQAMLAARHSQRVVAIDSNPRALDFARFNAELNGFENIEFLEGDRFEPVAGETFDLIFFNAPSSVSPLRGTDARDQVGNELVDVVVKTVTSYLKVDGVAQIVANWAHSADESWTEQVTSSLKNSGCNAWVARQKSERVADFVHEWFYGYDSEDAQALAEAWMEYYRGRGIVSIDTGMIAMRRSQRSRNWVRVDSNLPPAFADAGAHVARCFWLQDFLDSVPGYELLDEAVYLSPSVELDQTSVPSSSGWKIKRCALRMTRGIGYSVSLDADLTRVVAACGGRQTLGRLLEALAEVNGDEFEQVVARYVDALRRLVTLGFLWPVRHGLEMQRSFEQSTTHATHREVAASDTVGGARRGHDEKVEVTV